MSFRRILFNYEEKESFLHSIDPISKLVWVIGVFVASILINHAIPQIFLLGTVFLTGIFLAKISIRESGLLVAIMGVFSILFFIFQSLVIGGPTVLFRFGWLSFSAEGMDIAGAVAFRGLTIVCVGRIFVGTTDPRDFALALVQKLKISYVFAFMILMVLRYFPLFEEEYRDLRDARAVRGILPVKGIRGVFTALKQYGIPLISRGLRRAETTSYALDSRAFRAYPQRTYTRQIEISRKAIVLVVFTVSVTMISAVLNHCC